MRLFNLTLLLFLAVQAAAQQPFQGRITYAFLYEKDSGAIKVSYGPSRLKVQYFERGKEDRNYGLVNLDSGKMYMLNSKDSTYELIDLAIPAGPEEKVPKTIAGYSTHTVIPNGTEMNMFGPRPSRLTLRVADELYYPVYGKNLSLIQLPLVVDDHILLGMEMSTSRKKGPGQEEQFSPFMSLRAVQVESQKLDATEFDIPAGFTEKKEEAAWTQEDSVTVVTDTAYATVDTTWSSPPSHKDPAPKPKPVAPKKAGSQKGEATKPKKKKQ